jgi:biotin carboxyl carrier protein
VKLKITVHGIAYEVEVEVLDPGEGFPPSGPLPVAPGMSPAAPVPPGFSGAAPAAGPIAETPGPRAGGGGSVACPIAGTVVEIKCRPGDKVVKGQALLVVEAMKMNTSITAPSVGTVRSVLVAAGDNVREGQTLVEFA